MKLQEAVQYAYSKAGIANCFLRDVATMRMDQVRGETLYWLGNVPCAVVMVVAIVVGVCEYNSHTSLWLDDGSDVVQSQIMFIKEPFKVGFEDKTKERNPNLIHEPPTKKVPQFPVPPVGSTVKILGKVRQFYDTRYIRVDQIAVSGRMEEVHHWNTVIGLHKFKYSQPFVLPESQIYAPIPSTPHKIPTVVPEDSTTPKDARHTQEPGTPQAIQLSPESVRSFASVNPVDTSLDSRIARLRHPSRLKRQDLTLLQFRLYIKYFMDMVYPLGGTGSRSSSGTPINGSPAKRSPKDIRGPRAADINLEEDGENPGFTLAYLRRVPELRSLAARVAQAERRRVAKEKENRHSSNKKGEPQTKIVDIKRLFRSAVASLLQDGALAPHEGRARKWNEREAEMIESLRMWKVKHTEDLTQDRSKTLGTIDEAATITDLEGNAGFSDEEENEECFVPVSADLLARPVLAALKRAATRQNTDSIKKRQAKIVGISEEKILDTLRDMNDRWQRVGNIDHVLRRLVEEGEVWEVKKGVWALLR